MTSLTNWLGDVPREQFPRLRLRPHSRPQVSTDGDLAAEVASQYGLTPDPWQKVLLNDWLAIAADGKWCASTDAVSVARQNGKNGACEVLELYALLAGYNILHTAHEVKTAKKHFDRMRHFFGESANDPDAAYPELNKLVKSIRKTNGQESILLKSGAELEVSARSDGAGRGFTADILVCDEAQHMEDKELDALKPILSSGRQGNPKTLLMGTPPPPSARGEVFPRTRDRARSGEADRLGWAEYSPEDDADISDPDVWRRCNPALITGRLMWDQVMDEHDSMSEDGFARERLGRWDSVISSRPISDELWSMAQDTDATPVAAIALAVDVAPDAASASIAMAGQTSDGRWVVQILDQRAGADWVPARLVDLLAKNPGLHRAVMLDVGTAAQVIVEDLIRLKIKYTPFKVIEVGAAHQRFLDGLRDGSVVHVGQPQLTYAIGFARKRRMAGGDMWAWNRKDNISDITPLVACTYALFGAQKQQVAKPKTRTGSGKVVVFS